MGVPYPVGLVLPEVCSCPQHGWGCCRTPPMAPSSLIQQTCSHVVILYVAHQCCTLLCEIYLHTHVRTQADIQEATFMPSSGPHRAKSEPDSVPALERCGWRVLCVGDSPRRLLGKQQGHFGHNGRAVMQLPRGVSQVVPSGKVCGELSTTPAPMYPSALVACCLSSS